MIKIIAGEKGTGKTAKLVDDINEVALSDNNVVCIVRNDRLNQEIKPSVRLVNVKEYPVAGYGQLLAFIAGICAKDFDITHLYIDSIKKLVGDDDLENLGDFLKGLDALTKDNITTTIFLSASVDSLPDSVKAFI